MSQNSFSGSIPKSVSSSSSLKVLRLQNNKFSGSIPDTLFKSEVLQILDLRNNKISGIKTPNIIGERSTLHVLLLRNNSLQSHIPEEICQLGKIGFLDLSHNIFKGVIPSCFGNMSFGAERQDLPWSLGSFAYNINVPRLQDWKYTATLNFDHAFDGYFVSISETIVDFLTKSRYEAYQDYILQYMSGLDLSSNELSGEIPDEIGNLQSIRSLNFSSNRLTGSIPSSISNLKDLESLDLSNNMLKGSIPTNISCNPTIVPEPSASLQDKDEEDGVINMVWFYWTCGAVYISTPLALFAFLCIDSRWSREWFYRVDLFVHHLQQYSSVPLSVTDFMGSFIS